MTDWELPEIDLSEIGRLPDLGDNLGALDKLPGLNKLLGISSSLMWALSVELQNEEIQAHFAALGKGKRNYTSQQKDFLLSQVTPMVCGQLQESCKYHAELFNAGAEDMASGIYNSSLDETGGICLLSWSYGVQGDIKYQSKSSFFCTTCATKYYFPQS